MRVREFTILILFGILSFGYCALGEENKVETDIKQLRQEVQKLYGQVGALKVKNEEQAAEIRALREKIDDFTKDKPKVDSTQDELESLRALAISEAQKEPVKEEIEDVVFKAGSLGLQALNPEISVTGDIITTYEHRDEATDYWRSNFRGLGLHFESYLDPYTRFKAAVPVNEKEAKLGEAYLTRFGILKDVNLTLGKFRQQFGVVNRWHKHGLDQVDFPLALRRIFGEGGLNQTGLSLDWNMPSLGKASQELTFQVTNGENSRLFGDNSWTTPSLLLHYKNFRDLTKNTYLECGTTALLGWNNQWQVHGERYENGQTYDVWSEDHDRLLTWVFGGDLSLRWEPTERMRYRNVEWRTEFYYLDREIQDPFVKEHDHVNAWGGYSYIQTKLSRRWETGLRLDYYEPDYKHYAARPEVCLTPLAYPEKDAYRWQVGPYVTWHQSPFVRFRLEYNHEDGRRMEDPLDRIMLQVIFAAGPHKHERY